MNDLRLAFGTGTGRCGSKSLRVLALAQPRCGLTHERLRLPWVGGEAYLPEAVARWREVASGDRPVDALWEAQVELRGAWDEGEKIAGDIGPWYIPLVPVLIEEYGAAVVHLERDCDGFVQSVMSGTGWLAEVPEFLSPRSRTATMYWSLVHTLAQEWQRRYPGAFRIWPTRDLNSQTKQREMMQWIGVADPVTLDQYPAAAENRLAQVGP